MAFWRGTGPAKLVHRSAKAQRQVGDATSDEHEKCDLKPEFSGSIRQIFSRYCRRIPEQGLCSGIELGAFVISEELPKPDGLRARLKQGGEGGWTQAPKNLLKAWVGVCRGWRFLAEWTRDTEVSGAKVYS
jgi:hypothetical protein